MNYAPWIVQGLLALIFLFAGGMKLVLPVEEMTKQMPLIPLMVGLLSVFVAYDRWRLTSLLTGP